MHLPRLEVNTGLTLACGDTALITKTHLRLNGGEPKLLDIMLLSPPLHGALVRDGFALTGGDIFTQEDIDKDRLLYRHDGGAEEHDRFTFASPEGEVPPTVFSMTIAPGGKKSLSTSTGYTAATNESASYEISTATPWTGSSTMKELVGDGMAVVRLTGEGRWQYSLDDGHTWCDFGPVYHGRARLLRAEDRVRFRPSRGAAGLVVIAGRPWDGQSGTAGDIVSLASRSSHGEGTPFGEYVKTRKWDLGEE
jgi:hypothetical protein